MCGNGGRCLVAFARYLGLVDTKARFTAIDGEHEALVSAVSETDAVVKLRMNDVKTVEKLDSAYFLDTGSPHYVSFRKDLSGADVYNDGRAIRYSPRFEKEGTNVNFVEQAEPGIYVRTYERGVEAETYSCGTGVTAAVLASYEKGLINDNHCRVKTLGGYLTVYFEADGGKYENIWLEGPATYVFKGSVNV
jgi:diaminopimelate epimerase